MNKTFMSATLVALAAMGLASCASSKKTQADYEGKNVKENGIAARPTDGMDFDHNFLILSDTQRDIVKQNNAFALQLYRKTAKLGSQVVSPMSVAYLMGMLANGANGETLKEIMHCIGCDNVRLSDLNELYKALMQDVGRVDKQTQVKIANYVAVNKEFQLDNQYRKTVADNYKAEVENLDFGKAKAVDRINGWCAEHTDGMVPRIVDQLDASAVSVLMNAIYFNGTWRDKFDAHNTREQNFYGYTRNIQKVQMMRQVEKFAYMDNDSLQAVSLPYGNGVYSMTVLLPKQGIGVSEMMGTMTPERLTQINSNMDMCMVDLWLPRFTTETTLQLNDVVSSLGAPSIFEPGKADFGRFASGDFYISQMLQKAKIEVSEEGTKAAAVTAAVMLTSMAPMELRHVEFHADRPFVYLITDSQSGAILFMGQYTGR